LGRERERESQEGERARKSSLKRNETVVKNCSGFYGLILKRCEKGKGKGEEKNGWERERK